MSAAVDRHRTRIGAQRKRTAEAVEWAREAAGKCKTDAELAAVLMALLDTTKDGAAA